MKTEQPDLFSTIKQFVERGRAAQQAINKIIPRARATDPSTSHRAAASVKESASAQRARCLEALFSAGPLGATADEIDKELCWRVTTAGRRLPELELQGAAQLLGIERPTRSGRAARVYVHHSFKVKTP